MSGKKKKRRSQRPAQIKKKHDRAEAAAVERRDEHNGAAGGPHHEEGDDAAHEGETDADDGVAAKDGRAMIEEEEESPTVETDGDATTRILLVDDNAAYRRAFRRRLMIEGFSVDEAADADECLERLATTQPDLVITDLAMRTETEGLTLIRRVKALQPLLPIIMISAVGTFEEGAEASRLGAVQVVSKSRIDQEIDALFRMIALAREDFRDNVGILTELQSLRAEFSEELPADAAEPDDPAKAADALATLQRHLENDKLDPYLKSEAFDTLLIISSRRLQRDARRAAEAILGGAMSGPMGSGEMDTVLEAIAAEVPGHTQLHRDTLDTLRTAEYLYQQQEAVGQGIDFSRNVSFSYCFAVENEAKVRMRRKLHRLFGAESTYALITQFMEGDRRHLTLHFHQFILQSMRGHQMDVTIENVRQTLLRILDYRTHYKPDGLKALGVVIMLFGRTYSFRQGNKVVAASNPLGLRGLETDAEVLEFAERLIALQHYRNPYIHPEISEPEKVSKIRDTAFSCLRFVDKLV